MKNLPTRRGDDKGFTLIELMVVVLIIAILLAIAIPTFLGAQNKAKDRSAQSSARNALTNAKTLYADTGDYSLVTDVALKATEPALTFIAGTVASDKPKIVSVSTSADTWFAAVMSETGTCYYIKDSIAPNATPGTWFSSGSTACSGDFAAKATGGPTWTAKW